MVVVMALLLFLFNFASDTKKAVYGPGVTVLRYEGGQMRHPQGPVPTLLLRLRSPCSCLKQIALVF